MRVSRPCRAAMPAGGRRSERLHSGRSSYAIPPASGGLCRLKPAFQAVALPGQTEDRRSLS